ncbi:MoxR family ATPase [Sphingomonas sp. SUN019]|uniref:AAA family ATPase n=1 Tax=Sphingomonas sp. SUN019 TaxID=2937788 RepID=UPI0021642655|nr:MoxR family ATPase [Sphingomonas sp. SUN019]UVO51130.1 MoxR family ATPase [Sphingomonas sp. SUN019]
MAEFLAIQNGAADDAPGGGFTLRPPLADAHRRIDTYRPADGLVEAMDVAMLLGVPLLLTGEPGTGKTQAAYWLAAELGRPLLRYNVKSGTTGSDLLYSFDEVARFRDASSREVRPLIDYVRFNALGLAILRGGGSAGKLTDMLGQPLSHEAMVRAFGGAIIKSDPTARMLVPSDAAFASAAPEHCVVLIDELDKAPRDTPNDLLAEIETMRFAIPELGVMVPAGSRRPIVILTSNSERSLPEPFLRRCAYFDIPFPREAELARIVSDTLDVPPGTPPLTPESPLVGSAVSVFLSVHDDPQVRKRPGTAELLAWVDILLARERLSPAQTLAQQMTAKPGAIERTLCALLKSRDDLDVGLRALRQAPAG